MTEAGAEDLRRDNERLAELLDAAHDELDELARENARQDGCLAQAAALLGRLAEALRGAGCTLCAGRKPRGRLLAEAEALLERIARGR